MQIRHDSNPHNRLNTMSMSISPTFWMKITDHILLYLRYYINLATYYYVVILLGFVCSCISHDPVCFIHCTMPYYMRIFKHWDVMQPYKSTRCGILFFLAY